MDVAATKAWWRLATAALLVFCTACWGAPPFSEVVLRLDASPERADDATVVADGLDSSETAKLRGLTTEEWRLVFPVYTGDVVPAEDEDKPPVLGEYLVEDSSVRFRPRFPLVPGLSYYTRFDLAPVGLASVAASASFVLAREVAASTTQVAALYPTADELPENVLRFYIHFSASMSRGEAYERIHIFDEDGEVEAPFVEITQELWGPEMRRLTLLFDPGRIKRGLRPHDEVGPPLVAGHSYRLVIDDTWLDGRGNPLKERYEKSFRVTDADRTSPDPAVWQLQAPPAASREALVVTFPEPLDQALLLRLLRPQDAEGREVVGQVEVSDGERRWAFTPDEPWREGSYGVEVETILEDPSGNSLRKVFDVDLEAVAPANEVGERISLPFVVGPSS